MAFHVFIPEPVQKGIDKLDKSGQARVEKILKHLHERGSEVGKPLAGLSFLREKKFNGKRLYYLVYGQWSTVLVAAISDKKAQQATINRLIIESSQNQMYVFDLLKKKGII
ncbi:hypothetical protein HYV83_03890 [Candidatus Woesearchaeota archaeon]|nr:hypothetical protein [Candidatus Woesearchaeota archaeon]